MSKLTSSKRTAKNVKHKIEHIERSWRKAHNFATSETGAGDLNENEGTFKDTVLEKCLHYYDLLEVMQDRASSKPKFTNYDLESHSEDDDEEEEDDAASALSEESGGTKQTSTSSGTKQTSTSKTSTTSKKRKTASLLMDDSAVAALSAGNKALEQRFNELARHNKVVENMEVKRFALEEKKYNQMAWQGKNDELNYKMNLLHKYQTSRP
jgi:hypothetical protein